MADWNKAIFGLADVKILLYLKEKGKARYYELADNVVETRSTLASSLRELAKMGLVRRQLIDKRPVQTQYMLTDKGSKITSLILQMRQALSQP